MTTATRTTTRRAKGGRYEGMDTLSQILLCLLCLSNKTLAQQALCSLCENGSTPPDNGARITFYQEEWNCADLSQIMGIIGLTAGSADCFALQFGAFTDCGCPTFPQEAVCSLCPGGSSDLPQPDISIPGQPGLTCGDIVFSSRDEQIETPLTCEEVQRFSRLCRCPEACSLCRYSDEAPQFPDRILPFLSSKDNPVTCADHAGEAKRVPMERCDTYRKASVPVDVPAFCGCPVTKPANVCSLCPDGKQVLDRSLVIPQAGGETCEALEQYIQFITDKESCLGIASVAEACCQEYEPCPICLDGTNGLGRLKTYEPYSLSCDHIGLASRFGFPLTCGRAQERFPFFCGCRGASPDCTICPLGMLPPDPNRYVPLLNMTCGQVNDFVSLRSADECQDAILSFSIDVAAFCDCIPTEDSLARSRCALCPEGQVVLSQHEMPNQVSITESGSTSTTSIHCHDLAELAPYVVKSDLCRAVQQSTLECCGPIIPISPSPTVSSPPFPLVTTASPVVGVSMAPQQVVVTIPPGNTTLPTQPQPQPPQTLVPDGVSTNTPVISLGSPLPTTASPQQTVQPALNLTTTPPAVTTAPALPIANDTLVPATTAPPANVTPPAATPAPTEDSGGATARRYWIWTASSVLLVWGSCS